MKLTHEQQREIAQKVLKLYGVHPNVSNAFRKGTRNHRLYYSERANATFPAILYFVSNIAGWPELIKEYESKTGRMAFHATLTHTEFGDLLDILTIPADTDEIDEFMTEMRKGYFRSYCYNLTTEKAESGYIQVRPRMGGLTRVA